MAARLFGAAVDYVRVRIYARPHKSFGQQPANGAMTPNGHLYFHKSRCLADFSCASEQARHGFLHEMVKSGQSAHRKRVAPSLYSSLASNTVH